MSSSTFFPHFAPPSLPSRRPRHISASVSDHLQPSAPSTLSIIPTPPPTKPLRKIPGDYGLPFIGPIRDRFSYFYTLGRDDFFRTRIQKHHSTVLRLNMPPGPFISKDARVIALFDAASFPTLFDVSKVEKRDLFTGTYMPSTDLTGGYRVLSYLDPSEPSHALLKKFLFFLLASRRNHVIPEFREVYGSMFGAIESELASKGKADFGSFNDQAAFAFLARSLLGTDPANTGLGSDAPGLIMKWVVFQLGPLVTLGLPPVLDDLLLRVAPLPSFLVKSDYRRLYDFFYTAAAPALDEAEKMGISREEACHNILFATCFNSFGGMKIFFPTILKWVARGGAKLHADLAAEVRAAVAKHGGEVTMRGIEEDMPLLKSAIYEAFRIEPPVPMQYGKAKEDLVVESHDAAFEVRKGEMLFGYQPFATKDGRVFDKPEEYVARRFLGEGERLLKHVVWSNGPETGRPTTENKQCAGKDFVVLMARLLLVELFLRYDSFDVELGTFALGTSVTVTSLKRASS